MICITAGNHCHRCCNRKWFNTWSESIIQQCCSMNININQFCSTCSKDFRLLPVLKKKTKSVCHSIRVFSFSIIFLSLGLLISGETLGRVWKHLACPAVWGHCFASHAVSLTGPPHMSVSGLECVETRDIWLKDGHIPDSGGSPTTHIFFPTMLVARHTIPDCFNMSLKTEELQYIRHLLCRKWW